MKAHQFPYTLLVLALLFTLLPGAPQSSARSPEAGGIPEKYGLLQFSEGSPPAGLKAQMEAQSAASSPSAAPSNDDIGAARLITALPYQHSEDTTGATVAADDPDMGCGTGTNSNTVWYRLVPGFAGAVMVDTFGSDYDTVLAVFTGTRGALHLIGCNDDSNETVQSSGGFYVEAGVTYYIEVADYGGPGGGLLVLHVESIYESVTISNSALRVNVAVSPTNDFGNAGRFVIGTTGGDPTTSADNNKRMLYGYPSMIGTSYATVRVTSASGTVDYRLGEDVAPLTAPSTDGTTILVRSQAGPVLVEQRLYLGASPDSGRQEAAFIEYRLTNNSSSAVQAGLRAMLDTMIGDNDGAPLFVPGYGRIETEREFLGEAVPDYWVAWESPYFDPSLMKAKGYLRGSQLTVPDRVIIGHWAQALCPSAGPGLYNFAWDYPVSPGTAITCDSAVALYYNPLTLGAGQTRTIRTIYALAPTGTGLDLAPDVAAFVQESRQQVLGIGWDARDVAEVGDYFLDKLTTDYVKGVTSLFFEAFDTLSAGVSWAKVGRGLGHIGQPGYEAALHASWRGWTEGSKAARHWYKPMYDALHNGREITSDLFFKQMAWAGLEYYGKDIAEGPLKDWLLDILIPGMGDPLQQYAGTAAYELAESYGSELQREQDELIARLAVQSLTPQQIEAYRADMAARQVANAALAIQAGTHRDLLWESYQDRKASEANWLNIWGWTLLKWAAVGTCTLLWNGPGYYISSLATSGLGFLLQAVHTARALTQDQKMTNQACDFLVGRVSDALREISLNTVAALNLVRAGDPPQIAQGSVSVAAMNSYGHWRVNWPVELWWAERSSSIKLAITNDTDFETTCSTAAGYNHTRFFGGPERFLPEGEGFDLAPYSSRVATIPLKWPDGNGESPDEGSDVDLLVLGHTDTGTYVLDSFSAPWLPTKVEEATGKVAGQPVGFTAEQVDEAPTLPYPVSSTVVPVAASTKYWVLVDVVNPFQIAVQATITQTLPPDFTVLEAGGAAMSGNTLVWKGTLQPGTAQQYRALCNWSGAVGQSLVVAAPMLQFRDPTTGQGDEYPGTPATVEAAWPVDATGYTEGTWQIGKEAAISFRLTNIWATQPVDAVLTTRVETMTGTLLWTDSRPVHLAPEETQEVSLTLAVPRRMGFVAVRSDLGTGDRIRTVLLEAVEIRGIPIYLPLVVR